MKRSRTTPVILTIDGPAGTGKSSVAHRLARRLGLEFLDTGAMYRTVALIALERGIDPMEGRVLAGQVDESDLHFDWTTDPPRIMVNERDVSKRIRQLDVNKVVSIVAAQPEVRESLVQQQRKIAARHPRLVTEGRDQGSVVFPDAAIRFYLDAAVEIRARRRVDQLREAGIEVSVGDVISEIERRDTIDSTRADGPLMRPVGAIEIDTSDLTLEQVVDRLESIARERLPRAGFAT
jgi:cytidylate kinase